MKKTIGLMLVLMMTIFTLWVYGQDAPVTTHPSAPDGSQYQLMEVASGFQRPVLAIGAGDGSGRLFVVSQYGQIFIVADGQTLATPFLDVSSLVSTDSNERGLLGLAFHPNYQETGTFFINYTDKNGDTAIAKYQVSSDPNVADPSSGQIILGIPQPYANHNGGNVVFGPDGYLYIGMGDGGSQGDPNGNGQNGKALLGKILRLDVDSGTPYGIPTDNPSVGNSDLAPEVWALGLRNPWRFTFDKATGDLYIGDVGQNKYEEVDFQPAGSSGGENYGWNVMEASHQYSGAAPSGDLVAPIAEYPHGEGCSISGGYVYRGSEMPELDGYYFFGDYCNGTIWTSYRDDGGAWHTDVFFDAHVAISSFGQDDNGELYVIDHGGSVLKLVAK